MKLTKKETMFLNDFASQEQLCAQKYEKYASLAEDKELKKLFSSLGSVEQTHLESVNTMLSGSVPEMNGGHGEKESSSKKSGSSEKKSSSASASGAKEKMSDEFMCSDCLSMEKHVSSVYNTGIFEFKNEQVRSALNHIQKEEQEHGKRLYDYMQQNGMY